MSYTKLVWLFSNFMSKDLIIPTNLVAVFTTSVNLLLYFRFDDTMIPRSFSPNFCKLNIIHCVICLRNVISDVKYQTFIYNIKPVSVLMPPSIPWADKSLLRKDKQVSKQYEQKAAFEGQQHLLYATFNYSADIEYSSINAVAIGSISELCQHCGAKEWKGETPSMCCSNGKVCIPLLA